MMKCQVSPMKGSFSDDVDSGFCFHSFFTSLMFLFILSAHPAYSENFVSGVLPQTFEKRVGNNLTILSSDGERFEGRAWRNGRSGFFCFSGAKTNCGGRYDASHASTEVVFAFQCLDGRKGNGKSIRSVVSNTAEPLIAEGSFSTGKNFVATFGPSKTFEKGVGCWY